MKDVEEKFCGACVSIPLSLAGAAIGSYSDKVHHYRKTKNISFLVGLIVTSLSFFIGYYYLFLKECSDCVGE